MTTSAAFSLLNCRCCTCPWFWARWLPCGCLAFSQKKTCSTMFGAPVHCTLGHLRLMDEIVNCLRSYCRAKGLLNAIICLFLRNYEPKMENSLLGPTRRCCTVTSVVGVVQSISYFDSARYIRFSK